MASSRGLRLASFDGGGLRAFSQLVMMRNFMHQLKFVAPNGGSILPCDHFDLIGGSDTGGLIAIMFVKLRMSADEAVKEFAAIAEKVYARRLQPAQRTKKLRECMRSLLRKKKLPLNLKLSDTSQDGRCLGFVVATQRLNVRSGNVCLRTYTVQQEIPSDITVINAVLATCALQPEFLPLASSNTPSTQTEYIGTGLGVNNPIFCVVREAGSHFRADSIKLLLSLGSGNPGVFALGQGTEALFELMQGMLKDSEETARRFQQREDKVQSYFRFSVEQGMEYFDNRAEALNWISVQTNAYLEAMQQTVDDYISQMSALSTHA